MKTEIEFKGESAEAELIHFLRKYTPVKTEDNVKEEISIDVEMKCANPSCDHPYYVHLGTGDVESFSELLKNGNYDLGLGDLCPDCEKRRSDNFVQECLDALCTS